MSTTNLMSPRYQLSDFLKSCRARTAPQSVGLAAADRRRTKGLRREDVAALAGLSATWYTWLEQGRDVHPSAEVLERLSATLQLSAAEREYLFLLAQRRPPPLTVVRTELVRSAVNRMLETIGLPALVHDLCWDVLAWSQAWPHCFPDFGVRPPDDRNLLKILLTEYDFTRDPRWYETMARRVVAKARLDFSQSSTDARWNRLLEDMHAMCPPFRNLWREAGIVGRSEGTFTQSYPRLGAATFEHTSYTIEGEPGLRLLIFAPLGDESRRVFDRLVGRTNAQA